MKTVLWVTGGLFTAFLLFGFAVRAGDPQTGEKDRAKAAINLCQKSQDDTLMPLDQRRFVRDTCDRMRGDYATQYGRAP